MSRQKQKKDDFKELIEEIIEYANSGNKPKYDVPVILNCKVVEADFQSRLGNYCILHQIPITYKYPSFFINGIRFSLYINNIGRSREHLENYIFSHLKRNNIPVLFLNFFVKRIERVETRWIYRYNYENQHRSQPRSKSKVSKDKRDVGS